MVRPSHVVSFRIAAGIQVESGGHTGGRRTSAALRLAHRGLTSSPGVWLPNSHGLIDHSQRAAQAPSQIWYISYPEGDARRITNDLNNYSSLSLNGDASALVAVQTETTAHIWVVPVGDPTHARQITKGRQDGQVWPGLDQR